MEQLSAQALMESFAVYGRFYDKRIAGTQEQLRDRLEIAPRTWVQHEVITREPDLLVVMMNPGGSRPLETLWDADAGSGFVSAVPDRTQYQIMRLMLAAQAKGLAWQHARILNLSDLRTPKSAEFIKKLDRYANHPEHSLFSDARQAESAALFANPSTPVLFGWGLNPVLGAWADRAMQAAQSHLQLGISTDGRLFRHPLPQRHDMQLAWLAKVVSQLPVP